MKNIIARLWEKAIFAKNAELTASSDYAEIRAMAKKSDIDAFLAEYNAIAPDKREYRVPVLEHDYITFDNSAWGEYVPFAAMGGCAQDADNDTLTRVSWLEYEGNDADVVRHLYHKYKVLQAEAIAAYCNKEIEDGYDWDGDVSVWIERHYYSGHCNAPKDGYYTGNSYDNMPVVFDTYADGKAWVEAQESAENGLNYGQYAHDTYRIVRACYS